MLCYWYPDDIQAPVLYRLQLFCEVLRQTAPHWGRTFYLVITNITPKQEDQQQLLELVKCYEQLTSIGLVSLLLLYFFLENFFFTHDIYQHPRSTPTPITYDLYPLHSLLPAAHVLIHPSSSPSGTGGYVADTSATYENQAFGRL